LIILSFHCKHVLSTCHIWALDEVLWGPTKGIKDMTLCKWGLDNLAEELKHKIRKELNLNKQCISERKGLWMY
jgi:hypothetical protein